MRPGFFWPSPSPCAALSGKVCCSVALSNRPLPDDSAESSLGTSRTCVEPRMPGSSTVQQPFPSFHLAKLCTAEPAWEDREYDRKCEKETSKAMPEIAMVPEPSISTQKCLFIQEQYLIIFVCECFGVSRGPPFSSSPTHGRVVIVMIQGKFVPSSSYRSTSPRCFRSACLRDGQKKERGR